MFPFCLLNDYNVSENVINDNNNPKRNELYVRNHNEISN